MGRHESSSRPGTTDATVSRIANVTESTTELELTPTTKTDHLPVIPSPQICRYVIGHRECHRCHECEAGRDTLVSWDYSEEHSDGDEPPSKRHATYQVSS